MLSRCDRDEATPRPVITSRAPSACPAERARGRQANARPIPWLMAEKMPSAPPDQEDEPQADPGTGRDPASITPPMVSRRAATVAHLVDHELPRLALSTT